MKAPAEMIHLSDTAKHTVDVLSVGSLIAVFFNHLPQVTALLVFLWTLLRIYESVLNIMAKRREMRRD